MRVSIPALVVSALFLAGCSTNANPMNWFGSDGPDESNLTPIESTNPLIPETSGFFKSRNEVVPYQGTPIDAISDLALERFPGGVIVRATGVSATQGAFNARLTSVTEDVTPVDGVLTFRFEAQYTQIIGGPQQSREVVIARQFTDQQLQGTRTIRVEGLQNALERRR